ncbi:hypothetical protein MMC29_002179 [Sticta canariensis]|nr:hypothetical protein [Sticta canariensis]
MDSTAACTGYYPITGIQEGFGPGGQVPARMEIDKWWNSNKEVHVNQVSLFIAALKAFQAMPITCKLSYFQVAGIHSQPHVTWDEDQGPKTKIYEGYCEHGTNRFPTWHRPYLLLFEQRLYQIMVDIIIPKFPVDQQDELKDAAKQWRLPFWDWASKRPVENGSPDYDVPQLVRLESVKIRGPEGLHWVRNPLYVFKMPDNVPMSDGKVDFRDIPQVGKIHIIHKDGGSQFQFNTCKGTSRYPPTNAAGQPNSRTFIEGYQDNDSIMRSLRDFSIASTGQSDSNTAVVTSVVNGGNLTSALREAFYRVIVMPNYETFSNSSFNNGNPVPAWDSIEALHGLIHGLCGGAIINGTGYGHMAQVPVAAFDPIFWLHHCNVDRLFAIWQAIHPKEQSPEYWFASSEDARKDLKPFRKDKAGTYWNSDDVYDTTKLGYTYSDLPRKRRSHDGTGCNLDDKQLNALKTRINELYGATRSCQQIAALTKVRPGILTLKAACTAAPRAKKIKAQVPKGYEKDRIDDYDYLANIKYERFALDGRPFTVHILIGKVPEKETPDDGIEYKNVVGDVYNFVAPIAEKDRISGGCANCRAQAEKKLQSTGQIVLTNALVTRHKQQLLHENSCDGTDDDVLASMKPEDVVKFLKRNLHWRVSDMNGKYVHVSSLKVVVAVGKANHYADPTKLSKYHKYKVLYEITAGQTGGANPGDNFCEETAAQG